MNPGGLYGEARPENFPTVNDYRNPLVAEAMKVMKYVNKFNRGIAKVQEMLKENGNPPAKFDVDTLTAFRVVVEATAENVPQNVPVNGGINGGINTEEKKNVGDNVGDVGVNVGVNVGVKITENQSKILDLIINNPLITHKEMAHILSITERTAERSTKILRDLNIIKREGSDKTGKWVILK